MLRIIKGVVGFLVVITIFVVVGVVYLTKFGDNSVVGKDVKRYVVKRPLLVRLFNLNKPGDARYAYLEDVNEAINVVIIYQKDRKPDPEIVFWIKDLVSETTGKSVRTKVKESGLNLGGGFYSDTDLDSYRKAVNQVVDKTHLNIIYLGSYQKDPNLIGLTRHKDTIFIFKSAIDELQETGSVAKRIEQSTIMHEWGHLLGLTHVEEEDCVMSGKFHSYSDRKLREYEVAVEYCSESKFQLDAMRIIDHS